MPKTTKPKIFRNVLKWVLWFLLFQFILINISASLHAWKLTHFYADPELKVAQPSSGNIFSKTWKLFSGIRYARGIVTNTPEFRIDTVQFRTKKGLLIDCWYASPDSAPKGTVILFHALTSNKGFILREASEFRYWGYNVFMVDLRGHGNSEGNITSLGFWETEEVKLAYDHVQKKGEKNIFLWGSSLGAVVITKAVHDYQIEPSGVILEMPFACLQSHLEGRSRVFGFPEEPFGFLVTTWVGIEQGYWGFKHDTRDYVRKLKCPVLLQWGTGDRYVMEKETRDIYNDISSDHKRLVIYDGADHQSLIRFDPEKWKKEVSLLLENPNSSTGIRQD